jgi:inorganic pyrophosphatase
VLTDRCLRTGEIVECEPIGLMEQVEDGHEDHNVLATLAGESRTVGADTQRILAAFSLNVFAHVDGKRMRVGRFLGRAEAEAHITAHRDRPR